MTSFLEAAERATKWVHRVVDVSLTRLELRLHVQRVGRDPSTREWAEATRRAAADGSLHAQIKVQPSVQELVERQQELVERRQCPYPGGACICDNGIGCINVPMSQW